MARNTAPTKQDPQTVGRAGAVRGLFGRAALFYRQVVAELRKVVWPGRAQLQTYVYTVIVFVVAMMLLVYGLDWVFVKIVSAVFG